MTMLGKANWWAPAPLRRLHDRFGLRELPEHPAPATTATRVEPVGDLVGV
jgi:putative drug exporter of the RND superfamily